MPGAKGKGGGKRQGAGRPNGSKNTLDYGEVAALAAAKLRPPPPDAPKEVHQLAARALQRITHVMEEGVWEKHGRNVLAAATRIREEACGPLTQRLVVSGLETLTDEQLTARLKAITEKAGAREKSTSNPDDEAP